MTPQRRLLLVLMTATLTSSFAVCLFPPFFPRLAEEKGATATIYGFVIGVNCLTSFLVTPMIGKNVKVLISWHRKKIHSSLYPKDFSVNEEFINSDGWTMLVRKSLNFPYWNKKIYMYILFYFIFSCQKSELNLLWWLECLWVASAVRFLGKIPWANSFTS